MTSSPPSSPNWEPPSSEELQRMLPQYEISGIIGRGGMGAVYQGCQTKLRRTVAIKLLPETFTQGEDEMNFAKRFEQEAQAMANLNHPSIISVYDYGETPEGQLYFVMEFVDGMDIHQYLQHHGGKLSQEQAINITAHVLDALAYAHDHGIVHRDIKPANILLNREGRIKIADFGLAKKSTPGSSDSVPALTITNMAMGTPDFVAPEALDRSKIPDHRADLYAVGVMLYQMLTGKMPRGHFKLPSEISTGIDPRLDQIVRKSLQNDPDDRYPNAAAVRADLDHILTQPMAHITAGQESSNVPAAVPVTPTIVKGAAAGKAQSLHAGGKRSARPASKTPIYIVAGLVALILVAWLASSLTSKDDTPPLVANPGPSENSSPTVASTPPVNTPAPRVIAKQETTPPPKLPDPEILPPIPTPSPPDPQPVTVQSDTPESVAIAPLDPGPTTKPEKPSSLTTIPGFNSRLETYLSTRRTQLGDLATKYLRGLDARLNQAADAGDLKSTNAFNDEKKHVENLVKALTTKPEDLVAAVADKTLVLPELPAGSPESLVTLRQTWTTEATKIQSSLDSALHQTLQALGSELTKARELDHANAVLAYRESLGIKKPVATPTVASLPSAPAPDSKLPDADKDKPFINSLGMKFVSIPDADVLFCIHEVRNKDYAAFAKENPSIDASWEKNLTNTALTATDRIDDHPVGNLNRDDAKAFCAWLSKKEGKTYRLPTDREWSIAVGLGKEEKWEKDTTPETVFKPHDIYPWGKEWPPPRKVGNYSDRSRMTSFPKGEIIKQNNFIYDDGFPVSAPVMNFKPNKHGLYDLSGNAKEWVEDGFSLDKQNIGVLRGGSWLSVHHPSLWSSNRRVCGANYRANEFGFRCVLAPEVPELRRDTVATLPTTSVATFQTATKEKPFENSLGMKFVPVIITGGPTGGKKILFSIWETRRSDYQQFLEVKKRTWLNLNWEMAGFEETPDHPAVAVSWFDATEFCGWLTKKERESGKISQDATYRLPKDHEWSCASGIGDQEDPTASPSEKSGKIKGYLWGTVWPPPQGVENYYGEETTSVPFGNGPPITGYRDPFPRTAPVGSFKPNELGLFDLGGNVHEWCGDELNPGAAANIMTVRGESWWRKEEADVFGHISKRTGHPKRAQYGFDGFRVVLETSAQD